MSGDLMITLIETSGIIAPLLFIGFHLLRPLLFLPAILFCISGGVLFGTLAGSLYSIIGITLSSITFYGIIHWMPKTLHKLMTLKQKIIGKYAKITTTQITLLRLIPFIHFHFLSICLIEISSNFKEYTKSSLLSNIPFVLIYTSLGNIIANLSLIYFGFIFIILLFIIYIIRKKENRIAWVDFFQLST